MVENPLHATVDSEYIKGHILEQNLLNIINVVKTFYNSIVSIIFKEHIEDRNLWKVIGVVKHLMSRSSTMT